MIYVPSEDSFLLAECVRHYRGGSALEIGVGSGIVLEALEGRFDSVYGTDIDLEALRVCRGRRRALLVCCDAASAIAPVARFDLIVSNPPYLPNDPGEIDRAVHGGPKGIEATLHFAESVMPLLGAGGKMLLVTSSLADASPLDAFIAKHRLVKKVLKEARVFFETLSVLELSL